MARVVAALPASPARHRAGPLVVMGVSGCGKSTVCHALADRLGWPERDGDAFHSPDNVAKMSCGTPLTDSDRAGWLAGIGRWLGAQPRPVVLSCSALKRSYRDRLRAAAAGTVFVHLDATAEVIAARMALRAGHFMPLSLLQSQFATLQPLQPDEAGVTVGATGSVSEIVSTCLTSLPQLAARRSQGVAS